MSNKSEIIFSKITFQSSAYTAMVALRNDELRKPLGLLFTENDLAKDVNDFLLVGILNDETICCCILSALDKATLKLRQMAVKHAFQKNGIGKMLLHFAERIALENNFEVIEMNARLYAKPFYEKSGYKIISDEFSEVGIPHIKMQKII